MSRILNSTLINAVGAFHAFRVVTAVVVLQTLAVLSVDSLASAADFPTFEAVTIDESIGKVCYAVTIADVNNDQRPDIVAVTENRVLWYQNPSWQPHVMIENQTPADNVCIAPHDIDGDGQIDFALGAGWTGTGTLHWIRRGASPDARWNVHSIGVERWLHRIRWADVLGKGTPQLVISPLNRTEGAGVRVLAFEIPADPVADRWPHTVLNDRMNRMHNHWHPDFDGDGLADTLTASQEGITLIQRTSDDWTAIRLSEGAPADDPQQQGAGEIKMGRSADGTPFITTVEPMHGHSVAVYKKPDAGRTMWNRHVIDTGFQRGHGLWTADLNGDGADEIVFGHSDTPEKFGVIIYQSANADGTEWIRHVVDEGGMATEDLIVHDLNADGRPDIVAGGRATHNLKIYLNSAP